MELITAIALLCQVHYSAGGTVVHYSTYKEAKIEQTRCQQSYVHCYQVNIINNRGKGDEVMLKCISERPVK